MDTGINDDIGGMAVAMIVRAELHCYHCGYVAAHVEGEPGLGLKEARWLKLTPEGAGRVNVSREPTGAESMNPECIRDYRRTA
jgi:hypothetical protein